MYKNERDSVIRCDTNTLDMVRITLNRISVFAYPYYENLKISFYQFERKNKIEIKTAF